MKLIKVKNFFIILILQIHPKIRIYIQCILEFFCKIYGNISLAAKNRAYVLRGYTCAQSKFQLRHVSFFEDLF